MSSTPLDDPKWDHFDRALLASAELDTPESGALGRATRALGAATLGSAVLVSASTSLGASSGVAAAAAVGVPLAAVAKALLLGAVLGTGFVGVVSGGFSPPPVTERAGGAAQSPVPASLAPRRESSPRFVAAPVLPVAEPALLAEPVLLAEPATGAQPLERRVVASKSAAPRERGSSGVNTATAVAPPVATSLAVEVELLDRARAALVRKDPAAALVELDRYAQLSIARSLQREASLLRIEALRDLGRAASAAELVKRLVDEDPQGLTGQRARELVR